MLLGEVLFLSAFIPDEQGQKAYLQVSLGEGDLRSKDELVA